MKRRPRSGIWPTRRDMTGCTVRVSPDDEDLIEVALPSFDGSWTAYDIDRREARMLARRLNQCLDATVKR